MVESEFRIEVADTCDAVRATLFLEQYLDEADEATYKTYSPANALSTINWCVQDPNAITLLLMDGERIAGLGMCTRQAPWFEELSGVIEMFYVSPDYRGTSASRTLRDACIKVCEDWGCYDVMTACESGMGEYNEALFNNLFAKRGFHPIGPQLRKRLR